MEIKFKKSLGQNFITDINLLSAIVADAGVQDKAVIEIGAGAGALTYALSAAAKNVIAFEIDKTLQPVLEDKLKDCPNVTVIYEDIMRVQISDYTSGKEYHVVANLPYYITTPILFMFLEADNPPVSITVMVQKEVADRIVAGPGTKDYGALSVAVKAYASAKVTRRVSRKIFYPQPDVDSAVIKLTVIKDRAENKTLRRLIRAAFAMRRKTLANNLAAAFNIGRDVCIGVITAAGFSEDVRGETLTVEQFTELARILDGVL